MNDKLTIDCIKKTLIQVKLESFPMQFQSYLVLNESLSDDQLFVFFFRLLFL